MVSSQLSGLTKGRTCKPFDARLLFNASPPDAVLTEQVEVDFSDVFGPLPVQVSIEDSGGEPENTVSAAGVTGIVYDDPAIVYSRSHSLLGPSSRVSQSLISKLSFCEIGDSVDLVESIKEESISETKYRLYLILDFINGGHLFFQLHHHGLFRDKIQQKIVKERMKLPKFLSSEAHSLLKGLLHKDACKRLGNGPGGSEEIKRCKWFKSIDWRKLEAREIQPSFRPEIAGKHCIANFDKRWTDMPLTFSPASSPKTNANPFTDFNYIRPAATLL
ncbi:Serine/threonine-protein kinase AtPK2/AtPK19 [Gossypium arboreum]|uniref:Serine/threonine-protein kinase AtPK2/AtPK19 n=1 Tax=Gossypium arboreum TaxID=29729 RepID=A0A0B0ML86_GOSAR|nr:Serine/threonine-protein kinase AtPK2/AtPK19 [Gossypium arboreum]